MKVKTKIKAGEGNGFDPHGGGTRFSRRQSIEGVNAMKVKTRVKAGEGNGLDPHGG